LCHFQNFISFFAVSNEERPFYLVPFGLKARGQGLLSASILCAVLVRTREEKDGMGGLFSKKKSEPATEFIIGEPIHSTFKHVGGHTGGDPMAALKELAEEDDKKGEKPKGEKEQEPASEKKEANSSEEEEGTSYDSDEYKETPASPKPTDKEKEPKESESEEEGKGDQGS